MPPNFLGLDPEEADFAAAQVAVLPLPYEGTITYGKGAAAGPAAILEASVQVELYDEILEREPYRVGIATCPAPEMPATPPAAVETACQETRKLLEQDKYVVALGGEHSLSAGVYRALAGKHPHLGVVQIDAHADLRDEYEGTPCSHACVLARLREETSGVLQLGIRSLSVEEAELIREKDYAVGFMHKLRAGEFDVEAALDSLPPDIFLTFDVDALDLGLVRATGAPEPGGFTWDEINRLLQTIFSRKRVVGFDMMELCGGDPPSAFTIARLLYRMIGLGFS